MKLGLEQRGTAEWPPVPKTVHCVSEAGAGAEGHRRAAPSAQDPAELLDWSYTNNSGCAHVEDTACLRLQQAPPHLAQPFPSFPVMVFTRSWQSQSSLQTQQGMYALVLKSQLSAVQCLVLLRESARDLIPSPRLGPPRGPQHLPMAQFPHLQDRLP
ncbi:hypothetical protein P7K49_032647 [Saguinus oedipus]|uniref:Uncharacterized protein n=1 Tax=Saguinus oedipus TaxID=9490 RepID=A0ABQ9TYW2_SAGOE|nr:hypothetical protein P7K49_032647 [Saguinus oedipus]